MQEEDTLRFEVPGELGGERVDKAVTSLLKGEITRTKVRKLVDEGNLLLDGDEVKPSSKVAQGQVVEIFMPPPPPETLLPQKIPVDILHEDKDLIVLNKPSGMVVHPAAGNPDGTLANALLYHCSSIKGGEKTRPGIVHRLDKDTSGLMVVAKSEKTHVLLSSMFSKKSVVREYRALVHGNPPDEGLVDTPYGRSPRDRKKFSGRVRSERRAITRFKRLEYFSRADISLVGLVLETGRTHQIRVHMSESGWPLVGDPVYGRKHVPHGLRELMEGIDHTLLHSFKIAFSHPIEGSWIEFTVGPEPVFQDLIEKLSAHL